MFPNLDAFVSRKERLPDGFTYGTTGTPTQRNLESRIAQLDRADHCVVYPSGQAAICNVLLALLKSGDHLLMVDTTYGPARTFALTTLTGLGIEVEFYDAKIGGLVGAQIATKFKANTKLVWLESPGTMTMELQDVPAITAQAKAAGITTAIDNTWASPLGFCAMDHGVDLCIHACTKYMSGHSDVLMGSVTTNSFEHYKALRALQAVMGQAVSADDCFLINRGLETMQLRVERQSQSVQIVAQYLAQHPLVSRVLLPSLASSPDYAIWQRDFKLSGCVLSVLLKATPNLDAYRALFNQFKIFRIGASWGGVHSIAAFYPVSDLAQRQFCDVTSPVLRFSIGLEDPQQLIEELDGALAAFQKHCA